MTVIIGIDPHKATDPFAVVVHITGTGDMGLRTADSRPVTCLVPPPPR